ncbi:MAG: phage tail protein [Muribaculaceae bacterium]|nr:phage tail protein [Muribaculaceae bacterium]
MSKIIKGDNLMLFDAEGKSLAFATAHTLTITADAVDISSKDHGIWGGNEVNKITWEISSENLYTVEAYDSLFEKMIAREAIDVFFGLKRENDPDKTVADGDYPNWTKEATCYNGKAFITSLTANANSGENATFSLTLTGTGKITKATATGE